MTYYQDLRLQWIVESIRVYGFINREHLQLKFGISTPQASKDLQLALRFFPDLMQYDKHAKRYVAKK